MRRLSLLLPVLPLLCAGPAYAGGRSYHLTPANLHSMGFDLKVDYVREEARLTVSFPAERRRKETSGKLERVTLLVDEPLLEAPLAPGAEDGTPSVELRVSPNLLSKARFQLVYGYGAPDDVDAIGFKPTDFLGSPAVAPIPNPHVPAAQP